MVDYRATSLRLYLGNLRAAGYVESSKSGHMATAAGRARAKSHAPIPVGPALFAWWRDRLPAGEAKILSYVAGVTGPVIVAALVGPVTGFQATTVRVYVNALAARRLIVRPSAGRIALAPILLPSFRPLSTKDPPHENDR
jgi:hypothetical protein